MCVPVHVFAFAKIIYAVIIQSLQGWSRPAMIGACAEERKLQAIILHIRHGVENLKSVGVFSHMVNMTKSTSKSVPILIWENGLVLDGLKLRAWYV